MSTYRRRKEQGVAIAFQVGPNAQEEQTLLRSEMEEIVAIFNLTAHALIGAMLPADTEIDSPLWAQIQIN